MELKVVGKKKVYEKKKDSKGINSEKTFYSYKFANGKLVSGSLKLPTDELEVDDTIKLDKTSAQQRLGKKK
jgi:hypothetical protein